MTDGKPVEQMFADDLQKLVKEYHDSGLTNAGLIGVLHMTTSSMEFEINEANYQKGKPF